MAYDEDTIFCCGASLWTKIAGWLGIFSFGMVSCGALILMTIATEIVGLHGRLLTMLLCISLFISTLQIALNIVLLIGDHKEKTSYLWSWIIISGTIISLITIACITKAVKGDPKLLTCGLLAVTIWSWFLYVVRRRVLEIEDNDRVPRFANLKSYGV